jgi:hypothetical protein
VVKVALFPWLLASACLIAGLYGALHNQISYTVSPDYFFAFKFHQFGITVDLQCRLGASLVGWYASWWMGLIIGVPVLLVGLVCPTWETYVRRSFIAFAIAALTALVVGLGALVYGYFTIAEGSSPGFWYPEGIADHVSFARAGNMHNFSYLGGSLGIITASAYLIVARLRRTTRPT